MGVNRVNVYDFDGTIYNGDSSVDIYFFLLKRYPKLIAFFPKQMLGIVKYKLHLSSKEEMKEMYFSFLKQNQNKIKEWYLKQKRKDDVIISASPEFLLKPICDILGIDNLIATKVELSSGKFLSKNCQGAEKVVRFEEIFSEAEIEAFYSDSKSDTYMAKLATKAFLIKNNRIIDWEQG